MGLLGIVASPGCSTPESPATAEQAVARPEARPPSPSPQPQDGSGKETVDEPGPVETRESAAPPSPEVPAGPPEPAGSTEAPVEGLEARLEAWVEALDAEDEELVREFLVTRDDLGTILPDAQLEIVASVVIPRDERQVSALLNTALDQEVRILSWSPGIVAATGHTTGEGPRKQIEDVELELSVGGLRIDVTFDKVFRWSDRWRGFGLRVGVGRD